MESAQLGRKLIALLFKTLQERTKSLSFSILYPQFSLIHRSRAAIMTFNDSGSNSHKLSIKSSSSSALGTSLISAGIPRSAAHLLYLLIQLLVESVVFQLLFKSCKYFSSFSCAVRINFTCTNEGKCISKH